MKPLEQFYDDFVDYWIQNPRPSVREAYLGLLGDVRGQRVIDIGCGCGLDIKELSKRGAHGTGLDFSKKSIQQAQKLIGTDEKWNFVCTDFLSYHPQEQYDIALFSMIVMHYPDLSVVFKHIASMLKEHGRLLLVTNNPYLVCADYHLPYPKENESRPYMHRFEYEGNEMTVEKYLHAFSGYVNRASENGLSVASVQELAIYTEETRFFNPVQHPSIPNFLTFLFIKDTINGYL